MKLTVTYEDGTWNFEVVSTGNEPSHYEAFEVEEFDEACETVAEILRELRTVEDPLADLFDEED